MVSIPLMKACETVNLPEVVRLFGDAVLPPYLEY